MTGHDDPYRWVRVMYTVLALLRAPNTDVEMSCSVARCMAFQTPTTMALATRTLMRRIA